MFLNRYIQNINKTHKKNRFDFEKIIIYRYNDLRDIFIKYYKNDKSVIKRNIELEDFEQEVLFAIIKGINGLQDYSFEENYVLRTVENHVINMLKYYLADKRTPITNEELFYNIQLIYGDKINMEERIMDKIFLETLKDQMEQLELTVRQQVIFVEYMLGGITQKLMADKLNVSTMTINREHKKIIKKIREKFGW